MIKRRHVIPILGAIFSASMCLLFIHLWGAEWYASYMEMSFSMAYIALATFAILFHLWRIVMIIRDKDIVVALIEKLKKDRMH
jgi:hypothetical protein